MKSEKLWLQIFSGFFLVAVVVGLVVVFRAPAPGRNAPEGGEKESRTLGGFFKGLKPSREGVAVVRIYGPIQTESSESLFGFYEGGADHIVKKIRSFRKNKLVKAIVVRVNSPGGTVAASQEILAEIKLARKDGKKVVVSMGDLAASGGYYVSCHADRIFADPGTLTGSIGVFVGNIDLTELARKIGVDMNIIKSGKFKDILSPWREMTEEERELLMETVEDVYGQFLEEVSAGRNMPLEELRPLADGRIFTGARAKEVKLVDELGGLQEAVAAAARMAGLEGEPEIIRDYETLWDDMFTMIDSSPGGKDRGLADILAGRRSTTDYVPVTLLYHAGG
jgi:protease-4